MRVTKSRTRPFTWMLGFALLALTVFAFLSIQSQRARLETRVQEDINREVATRVEAWERRLQENLDGWLRTAANGDARTAPLLQGQLQGHYRYFDSLYIWEPPVPNQDATKRKPARMLFPLPAPREDPLTRRHVCVAGTRAAVQRSPMRPSLVSVAEQYVLRCAGAPLNVRMHAYGEAAQLYDRAQRPQDALTVLEMVGIPRDLPATEAAKLGLTPFQLAVHKLRTAAALDALERFDEAEAVWISVARDIASLDAPSASSMLTHEWDVMKELRLHSTLEVQRRVASMLSRANRRAGAWEEVRQRTVRESAQFDPTQPGSFAYDQYQDTGFLLYYRGIPHDSNEQRAGAIVLDQASLLQDFMGTLGPLGRFVRVTDAAGDFVMGAEVDNVALRQTFPKTLSHLRIEIDDDAITTQIGRFGGQYYSFLAALSVFVTIGFLGLFAQHRASLRQEDLLMRQREFTTRITHELKTPLAGIRVTAENIDVGAFKDQHDLSQMAGRIVKEADALTDRVEEILAVSRERTIPKAELFDVEDILLETLSTWSPRYNDLDVTLNADLHVTDEVKGDPVAVRDAVSCLLDNALKYRDESRDDCAVWLTLKQEGGCVVIEVADNGLGVPPKLRKSIFKQFVRVEGPNRGKAGGHGLGLAQVARVAKAHGGTCVCLPSEHGGARFVLKLRGQG